MRFWVTQIKFGLFIRKNRNRSGSVSIQIIEKFGRKNKVLRTVGTSSDPAELQRLEALAKAEIKRIRGQKELFSEKEDNYAKNLVSSIGNHQIKLFGDGVVLGSIFEWIGYPEAEADPLFRQLVLCRIMHPCSKLKTAEYLYHYHGTDVKADFIYRFMDHLLENAAQKIEDITFRYCREKRKEDGLSIVFYDVTTLYFEAADEDGIRQTGFSKDGKHQHPQIKLGLLVSPKGFPLAFDIFEGRRFEGKTLIPVLDKVTTRFGIEKPIVVADAGLLSEKNIVALIEGGYRFVLAGRIKNENGEIKSAIHSLGVSEAKPGEIKKEGHRLIVSYSEKRAKKDRFNRERGLKRLEEKLGKGKLKKSSINNRGYNKYLKLEGKLKVTIDYEKFSLDQRWDGLKGYMTNTGLSPEEVIGSYSSLWRVEKAFRISKSDLKARPIFHRLEKRIRAHILICFAAYAVYVELERILEEKRAGFSAAKAIEMMKRMYQIEIVLPASKELARIPLKLDHLQNQLLKYFS